MAHEDFDREIEQHASEFGAAEAAFLAVVLAVLSGRLPLSQAPGAFIEIAGDLKARSARWVAEVLPSVYRGGVEEATQALQTSEDAPRAAESIASTPEHRAMLEVSQRGLQRDLEATADQMVRDSESALDEIARRNLEAMMAKGRNAMPQAREMAEEMRERGVKFTDRGGRKWSPEAYSRMLLRTVAVETANTANLTTASGLGSPGVRVRDGLGDDVDEPCNEADGQAWSIPYAMANKLEHPQCSRSFAPLRSTWTGKLDRE